MIAYDLTEYIINNNKIEEVLEEIGCFNIKSYAKEFRCSTPLNSKSNSTGIKKDNLKVRIYANDGTITEEEKAKMNLYSLVMKIKNVNFPGALKEVHRILGLKFTNDYKKVDKPKVQSRMLEVFLRARDKNRNNYKYEDLTIYNEDVCKDYIKLPYLEWVREGILPQTQELFNIGYCRETNRVVVPHRYWSGKEDEFVGVMGRTLNQNYDMLDIPKYFPLKAFPKSMNLYGLQENYAEIQKIGMVIVFESEKSVMKVHSKLLKCGVALGSHELSVEQVRILISLDVEVVFALDKDMVEQLSIDMCNQIKYVRKTSYIYDKKGLLGEKDAPIDGGMKILKSLLKNRIRIR